MKRREIAGTALAFGLVLGIAPSFAARGGAAARSKAPRGGTFTGVVINQRRQPVAGAKVSYRQLGVASVAAVVYVTTGSQGEFSFVNLAWGRYNVYAEKKSAGYPDQSFALYGAGLPLPLVALSPAHPRARVVVHVARAALLTGAVTDAANGKPVPDLIVLLEEPASGAWFSGTAPANLRVLIPPLAQVNVTFTAPATGPGNTFCAWCPASKSGL